jgi:stage V sporulation protein B
MTMSIILLPNVLTNSFSVLLLPAISEAKGQENSDRISEAIKKAILYGLLFGLVFTFLFLLTGDWIGNHLFHNALAGVFIRQLSWICPLMYISSLLSSILHGLGKAGQVLFINLLACLIRISMICLLVPLYGIRAYLWGLLLSSVFTTIASIVLLVTGHSI